MQTETLWLLVALIGLALLTFHLGFRRPYHVFQYRSQAAFLTVTFVLIPVVVIVLQRQYTAIDRLRRATGIEMPADLGAAHGIAAGWGDPATWLFDLESPSRVIDFYRDSANRRGWELVTAEGMVMLRRPGEQLSVMPSPSEPQVAFVLRFTGTD